MQDRPGATNALTDDRSISILYNGTPLSPLKVDPSHGGHLDYHLVHGTVGPPESSMQTSSGSVHPFLQGLLV